MIANAFSLIFDDKCQAHLTCDLCARSQIIYDAIAGWAENHLVRAHGQVTCGCEYSSRHGHDRMVDYPTSYPGQTVCNRPANHVGNHWSLDEWGHIANSWSCPQHENQGPQGRRPDSPAMPCYLVNCKCKRGD